MEKKQIDVRSSLRDTYLDLAHDAWVKGFRWEAAAYERAADMALGGAYVAGDVRTNDPPSVDQQISAAIMAEQARAGLGRLNHLKKKSQDAMQEWQAEKERALEYESQFLPKSSPLVESIKDFVFEWASWFVQQFPLPTTNFRKEDASDSFKRTFGW